MLVKNLLQHHRLYCKVRIFEDLYLHIYQVMLKYFEDIKEPVTGQVHRSQIMVIFPPLKWEKPLENPIFSTYSGIP